VVEWTWSESLLKGTSAMNDFVEVYFPEGTACHLLARGGSETVCGLTAVRTTGLTFDESKVERWLDEQDWGCYYCPRCLSLVTGWDVERITAWQR